MRAGAWAAGVVVLALLAGCSGQGRRVVDMATVEAGGRTLKGAHALVAGKARFTVVDPEVIRMEWSPSGTFVDRPSLAFLKRETGAGAFPFEARRDGGALVIETEAMQLRWEGESATGFTSSTLSVLLKKGPTMGRTWRPGDVDRGNLGGTARTLDGVSGEAGLSQGMLSRDGWVLVDDSRTPLLDETGWAVARGEAGAVDWYFLAHGRDYKGALRDVAAMSGKVPLPPRFVLGAWWSRYWAYSERDLRELVGEFRLHGVPLDVLVIDMDWHLEGWTGYTWNPVYFRDPEGFLRWCREQGLRTTLNLHPHDGVRRHEAAFPEMARAMGLDPATADHVPFDVTDRRYMDAYFRYLHHPIERQGVDFWWMDWQQGVESRIAGLDPLFWLNHLHWQDMEERAKETGRRPLVFSRWPGLGGQRYPIGFSGDTHCNWESLDFQPYFTATAGNVLYPYWSHDIGGHQPGPVEPELYTRWVQFGAMSPVLRTHATKNPNAERRIWMFPPEHAEAMRKAFVLRYAMVPYLYTMARKVTDEDVPLVRPLYLEWPGEDAAYRFRNQFMLGDALLVAPVTRPSERQTRATLSRVWLPPGTWTHWFTGQVWTGPRELDVLSPLDEFPLFVKAGAVLPLASPAERTRDQGGLPLLLDVFPGESGSFTLYEDDGTSDEYRTGAFARTTIRQETRDGVTTVTVEPAEGRYAGMPSTRAIEVRLRDAWPPGEVALDGRVLDSRRGEWSYDGRELMVRVPVAAHRVGGRTVVRVRHSAGLVEPLRAGLRGTLREIERYVEPVEMASRLKAFGAPATYLDATMDVTQAMQWAGTVETLRVYAAAELAPREASGPRRTEMALRLMGIGIENEMRADRDRKIQATVTVVPLRETRGLRASITPMPSVNHEVDLWPNETSYELVPGERRDTTFRFAPKGDIHPATDRIAFSVKFEGISKPFAAEMGGTVFPSLGRWWVTGPWQNAWEDGLDVVRDPEAGQFDVEAKFDRGTEGPPLGWKQVVRVPRKGERVDGEFYVDMNAALGGGFTQVVGYAFTAFESDEERDAVLALGSDDGVAVWLNGAEALRNPAGRAYTPREERVPVRLRKGRNELLLKVSQGDAGWGFCVHVEDREGNALPVRPLDR